VRDPHELCRLLHLPSELALEGGPPAAGFPLLVPRPYLARIMPGDPADPLLAQVFPRSKELVDVPGFRADPLAEANSPQPGLLAKYRGRSLIVTTGACAVHCRFCFRRHFPYLSAAETPDDPEPVLAPIAADASIHEVILSGGDPLVLPDDQLAQLARRISHIPQIRRLRIHTRCPIVIPSRVNDDLLGLLRGTRLAPILVVHVNHPREIDTDVAAALGRLVDAGVPVLSQSVLLRGVNDHADVLEALCGRLADLRVMPYYLHQLDRVAGAAHFEVPDSAGRELVAALRRRLPGYAVPRYVRETPGGPCKQLLA